MEEVPIPLYKPKFMVTHNDMMLGEVIDPIKRMNLFSADEFESFIELWVTEALKKEYQKVVRASGAGDKGRDVIAYVNEDDLQKEWDNFQCKHYKNPLSPSDIWVELGKLCYYTFNGDYTIPKNYYFVCQNGVGTTLNNYLENPKKLKSLLIEKWDKYCKNKISSKVEIKLSDELREHIDAIDFRIFKQVTPRELIDSLKGSILFATIFGGGLKRRREAPILPPVDISKSESKYTMKLFKAYEHKLGCGENVINEDTLNKHKMLKLHFDRQRVYYFAAMTLLDLERDTRPDNDEWISSLLDEVYEEIVDTLEKDFDNGYSRVIAVTDRARLMNHQAHPLVNMITPNDKHGICHHLANDRNVDWVNIYD